MCCWALLSTLLLLFWVKFLQVVSSSSWLTSNSLETPGVRVTGRPGSYCRSSLPNLTCSLPNNCCPRRTRWSHRPGLGSMSASGPQGLMQMCRLLYTGDSRCYSQIKGYQVGKKGQTSTKSGMHSADSSPLHSFTVCPLGFYWNLSSVRTEAFPVLFTKYSSWLCVQL